LRYGIISDIHANLPALERALEELDRLVVDTFLCLGDIVGYGAWPNECCDIVRELDCICVRGNHDEAAIRPGKEQWFTSGARACILWTREILSQENADFLRALEPLREVVSDELPLGITLCHGSVPDQDFYTTTAADAVYSFQAANTPLIFFGHTHYAEWFALGADVVLPMHQPLPEGGSCKLKPNVAYLINPGAVGQPRDGNPQASFAVYDTEAALVEICRFDYDIQRTQEQMHEVGLPEPMAMRLSLGI